jgi:hypothetical protein
MVRLVRPDAAGRASLLSIKTCWTEKERGRGLHARQRGKLAAWPFFHLLRIGIGMTTPMWDEATTRCPITDGA